jgi:hypothetical protein
MRPTKREVCMRPTNNAPIVAWWRGGRVQFLAGFSSLPYLAVSVAALMGHQLLRLQHSTHTQNSKETMSTCSVDIHSQQMGHQAVCMQMRAASADSGPTLDAQSAHLRKVKRVDLLGSILTKNVSWKFLIPMTPPVIPLSYLHAGNTGRNTVQEKAALMRQQCCQAMHRCALAAFGTKAGKNDQSLLLPEKQTSRRRDNGNHDLSEHNSSSAQFNRRRSTASITIPCNYLILKQHKLHLPQQTSCVPDIGRPERTPLQRLHLLPSCPSACSRGLHF